MIQEEKKTLRNPSKKSFLQLINGFIESAGYKINLQKLVVFLCSNNKNFKKYNSLYNSIKRNKIPRNIFNQGGKRSVQ